MLCKHFYNPVSFVEKFSKNKIKVKYKCNYCGKVMYKRYPNQYKAAILTLMTTGRI